MKHIIHIIFILIKTVNPRALQTGGVVILGKRAAIVIETFNDRIIMIAQKNFVHICNDTFLSGGKPHQ